MFCTKCGAEMKQGASYCTRCGHPVAGKQNLINDEEDELKKLEEQYQSLMRIKKQENQAKSVVHDIKNLQEEIDDLLQEAEGRDNTMEKDTEEQLSVVDDDLIEYCPECGFYVGKSMFCGQCGRKIRERVYGRDC